MSHLVHFAGVSLRAANVIRQRCAWCGALLEEINLEQQIAYPTADGPPPSPVNEDGTPRDRWTGLVAVEEHGEGAAVGFVGKWLVPAPEDEKIPADSCMALDPGATS